MGTEHATGTYVKKVNKNQFLPFRDKMGHPVYPANIQGGANNCRCISIFVNWKFIHFIKIPKSCKCSSEPEKTFSKNAWVFRH